MNFLKNPPSYSSIRPSELPLLYPVCSDRVPKETWDGRQRLNVVEDISDAESAKMSFSSQIRILCFVAQRNSLLQNKITISELCHSSRCPLAGWWGSWQNFPSFCCLLSMSVEDDAGLRWKLPE